MQLGLLNSLDYILIAYALWQGFQGFSKGFRLMLYETVKWFFMLIGIFLSNNYLYPYLLKLESFQGYSQAINDWFTKSALSLIASDNPLKEIIYKEVARSIPYDRIVFYILIVMILSFSARLLIAGSLFKRKAEGRLAGFLFGLFKAGLISYLIMTILASFMMLSNPKGFMNWQKESYILTSIGYSFGDRQAKLFKINEIKERTQNEKSN